MAGLWGKFFVFGEVEIFCSVRLSHAFCGWDAVRHDTLRVCWQAESRHSSKVSSPNASLLPIGCEAAPYKAFAPPAPNKNFPQEHPHHTKRNKFSPCKGGCSWGKFWEGQGGLEGRKPSTKEGFLRLQGLPFLQGLSHPPPHPNVSTQKSESSSRRRTVTSSRSSPSAAPTCRLSQRRLPSRRKPRPA